MATDTLNPLGTQRDTMYDNPLLTKPQLGVALKRGFTLPSAQFTYGRPNASKDGGAAEAVSGWTGLSSLPILRKEKKQDRDFIALNKAAVNAGLVSAPEQYQYRATHDVRRRVSEEEKNKVRTRRIPASMTFGVSTRPSTPVFDLIENKYQDRWLQERRKTELAKREKIQQKTLTNKGIYETRTSLLRKYAPPIDPPPLWQLPRFHRGKSASAHLETYRSPSTKDVAFKHHATDSTSRRGVFGHGIYEPASS
ncbi:cilia- and flagella-associated protein 77-like [Ptychodera flava]|uniref:cilia- and flagella-associated protein 77-like n=1 Tax=Ptychodera flava TaxID=63121 RepID=UPI003969F7AD